jgi:hypothetical protein
VASRDAHRLCAAGQGFLSSGHPEGSHASGLATGAISFNALQSAS